MSIEEEHYKFITTQIIRRDHLAIEYLKTYVQFFTAIVAGSVWLRTHAEHPIKLYLKKYTFLSNAMVLIAAALTIVLVFNNLRSWYGYRQAQAVIATDSNKFFVPTPKRSTIYYMESVVVISVVLSSIAFVYANPFHKLG